VDWGRAAQRAQEALRQGRLRHHWRVHQLETDYALFETELPQGVLHTLVVRVAPGRPSRPWECSHLVKTANGFISEDRYQVADAPEDYLAILDHVEKSLSRP